MQFKGIKFKDLLDLGANFANDTNLIPFPVDTHVISMSV